MNNFLASLKMKFEPAISWHKAVTDKAWLAPVKGKNHLIFAMIMIALAVFASAHMRHWQFDQWNSERDSYFLGDTPLFTTTDASYFLNGAKSIKETGKSNSFSALRQYPANRDQPENTDHSLFAEPLLSVMLAYLAPDASQESLLKTGNKMLPWTAAFTAICIVLAFGAAGFWAVGAVAAIGGSLSMSYLVRSSAGRIDTDQLNLGFFYLVTALVIWAAKIRPIGLAIGVVIIAGLTNNLYSWWWSKDILSWGFLGGLVWLSFAIHGDWRRTAGLAALFIVTSGTFWSGGGVSVSGFVGDGANIGDLILPNTYSTITELAKIPIGEVLYSLTGDVWIGIIALIGLAAWAFVHPVIAIVFLPALMLAVLNTVFGNRVIFFSAPLFWFGVGWVILTSGRFLADKFLAGANNADTLSDKSQKVQVLASAIGIIIGLSIAYLSSGNPITRPYVPQTSFSVPVVDGFKRVGDYAAEQAASGQSKKDPVIATWWDYGYAATLFSNAATLHDGGSQRGLPTHMFARALLSGSQYETARIIKFMANEEPEALAAKGASNERINQAFIDGPRQDTADIYLVLTLQMARWMSSISSLGMWDVTTGQPINVGGGSNVLSYQRLRCNGSSAAVTCNGQLYDFSKGTIDGQKALAGAVQTNNGRVGPRANYDVKSGFYVQLHSINDRPFEDQIIKPVLFGSTFNQLFFLGAYDAEYFTPVFDAFPHYRVYKVN